MGSPWLQPLGLAVCLFLWAPWARCSVVEDFNHVERCKDSLYKGTPPQGYLGVSDLKKICQRLADKPRFVTLYDPRKHMPLYSAYTFKRSDGEKSMDQPWMYEPQLAFNKASGNMELFPQSANAYMHLMDTQAVLEDFADVTKYERGQLNPDQHQSEPLDKAATYTLTNTVPQKTPQQLLPWQSLSNHWGHIVRKHDPAGQPEPRGHPRVHVDGLLLSRLRPQRPLSRALPPACIWGLRPE
uniref:DNA/RNA non-specific endonuclease/pyrophosphatase/phosphodiesterase domain-containing protein n=1 Tax=Esox lucius TaxID=8010 RepID=A0AAY5KQJ3_ESOLU